MVKLSLRFPFLLRRRVSGVTVTVKHTRPIDEGQHAAVARAEVQALMNTLELEFEKLQASQKGARDLINDLETTCLRTRTNLFAVSAQGQTGESEAITVPEARELLAHLTQMTLEEEEKLKSSDCERQDPNALLSLKKSRAAVAAISRRCNDLRTMLRHTTSSLPQGSSTTYPTFSGNPTTQNPSRNAKFKYNPANCPVTKEVSESVHSAEGNEDKFHDAVDSLPPETLSVVAA